jgi:hypothetical protein
MNITSMIALFSWHHCHCHVIITMANYQDRVIESKGDQSGEPPSWLNLNPPSYLKHLNTH